MKFTITNKLFKVIPRGCNEAGTNAVQHPFPW